MKTFVLAILSLSLLYSLSAEDYKNAEQELLNKNTNAVAKLAEVRAKIQKEKIRLPPNLAGLRDLSKKKTLP